jgi:hypothetical protein
MTASSTHILSGQGLCMTWPQLKEHGVRVSVSVANDAGALPPNRGRIYDRSRPIGHAVGDASLDIREKFIYGLLGRSCKPERLRER